MMTAIETQNWQMFLTSFSTQHHLWLINIESRDRRFTSLPLRRIALTEDGVLVQAGSENIFIEQPVDILLSRSNEGVDEALEIRTVNDLHTLRLLKPTRPELVDGLP